MGLYDTLTDIRLDLSTGYPVIDSTTHDGVLIRGTDVILQDAAIRLMTQLGEIQRQGLDDFGWDYVARIKQEVDTPVLIETAKAIERAVKLDTRIKEAIAIPIDKTADEAVIYKVTLAVSTGVIGSVNVTI